MLRIKLEIQHWGRNIIKEVTVDHRIHGSVYRFPYQCSVSSFLAFLAKQDKIDDELKMQYILAECKNYDDYKRPCLWSYLAEDLKNSDNEFYFSDDFGAFQTYEWWLNQNDGTRIIYSLVKTEYKNFKQQKDNSYYIVRATSKIFNAQQTWWFEEHDLSEWERIFNLKITEVPFDNSIFRG